MKKRQRKKNEKKHIPTWADEFMLLTMSEEERRVAWENYNSFRKKFAFRKRYKDLKDAKVLVYYFPVGQLFMRGPIDQSRKGRGNSHMTTQSLIDLQ